MAAPFLGRYRLAPGSGVGSRAIAKAPRKNFADIVYRFLIRYIFFTAGICLAHVQ